MFGKKRRFRSRLKQIAQEYVPYAAGTQGLRKWTPAYELEYWNSSYSRNNVLELCGKLHALEFWYFVQLTGGCLRKVADVGGGPYGGVLPLIVADAKVLFEPLPVNDLPGIEVRQCSAENISSLSEEFDAVFCLEALDHCHDEKSFGAAVYQIVRITKPGGLIFFEMPIRRRPESGHPISLRCVSRNGIVYCFVQNRCEILKRENYGPGFGSPPSFLLVLRKKD